MVARNIGLESFDSHFISLELRNKSDRPIGVDGRRLFLAIDSDSSGRCWLMCMLGVGRNEMSALNVVRSQVSGGDIRVTGFDCKD